MRSMHFAVVGAMVVGGLCAGRAGATVYFQDDFENEALGTALGSPPIGTWTEGAGTGSAGVFVVDSPARGNRSIRTTRAGGPPFGPSNVDLFGYSLPGAIVDGNRVEVKWSVNLEMVHSLNDGMQVVIGQEGSNYSNDFAFILNTDEPSGLDGHYSYYKGPAQYGTWVYPRGAAQTGNDLFTPSRNTPGANEGRWDDFRVVFDFDQINATTMGGTYSIYVSLNGAAERTMALNVPMFETDYSTGESRMIIRFNKGVESGLHFYDDVSIASVPVPEPASMGLAALTMGLLVRRSRK